MYSIMNLINFQVKTYYYLNLIKSSVSSLLQLYIDEIFLLFVPFKQFNETQSILRIFFHQVLLSQLKLFFSDLNKSCRFNLS